MSRDLEEFLGWYRGLALINIREDGCEASLYMQELLRDLERCGDIPVIRLSLTVYQEWAQAHGIYGTPALIAYYHGRPLFRLMGRVTPTEILQRLRDHGLLP